MYCPPPVVHAGCFSVSIVHQTLTWTTGSLTCAQILMHAIAHGGMDTERESALTVDSEKKTPCCIGELNLHQPHDAPMLSPTELHPIPCRLYYFSNTFD